MNDGKKLRLRRLFGHRARALVVPMDHGMTQGARTGLCDIAAAARQVSVGGADAVVVHKGVAGHAAADLAPHTSLIVHLSGSTNLGSTEACKVQVCSVEEAVRHGADAVSVHLNAGTVTEPQQLADVARVAEQADRWGIPLLAMVYVRSSPADERDPAKIAHGARLAAELGADLVKCTWSGDPASFAQVTSSCPVPVLIAGGAVTGDVQALFATVADALSAGAMGISIGRNIFEASDPCGLTRALAGQLRDGHSADEAYERYRDFGRNPADRQRPVLSAAG